MAAIQAGANSVYFGVENLNMRSRSSINFTLKDLEEISKICRENKIKSYVTVNTIIYDDEIEQMKSIIDAAKKNKINAVIASDQSAINYANKAGMEVHVSTQCNVSNIEAVEFYSAYADVMVTARELSLKQVASIIKEIEKRKIKGPSGKLIKIEIFAHGALCMAISGKCYLSLHTQGYSANRGACIQPCRRKYFVTDAEEGVEMKIDNQYIMSPKDLCTIGFIDKIIKAGVKILKIEGRGRSPEYVKTVTQCYREAVDSYHTGNYNQDKINRWMVKLGTVYNRGFWDGYYLGKKLGDWTKRYGSQATKQKIYIGKITNYFSKLKVAEVKMETNFLNIGDEVLITGQTTGVVELKIKEIRVELKKVKKAIKGDICSIPVPQLVRRNDKVYKIVDVDEF
ncbi:MAG: U32 family peptidase [Bacteroidales bacterium]|nr:U32 family peptidase [Bacteroidales bacterium]